MKHMIKIELLYSKEMLYQLLLKLIHQLQCKLLPLLTLFNPLSLQKHLENHSKCHMIKFSHILLPIVLNIKFKTMIIMKLENKNWELKEDSENDCINDL
jgi:hypothetical protein